MAEKVGDAYVELGTRDQALQSGLSGGLRAVRGFAIAASGILAGVAAGRGLSGLVGAYSDAVETVNKFNEVFSGSSRDINKAAQELEDSYGLIGTSSKKLLADTGDILVGFGFAEDAALDLAMQTNKLAVDLASFTNIEGGSARASQALTKALVGETEQAKALGIVIRQNSDEFKGIVKRLVETEGKTLLQAKALAALEIATKQSKKAQGDYARTSDQLANQMRLTGERITQVKEGLGGLIVRFASVDGRVKSLNESLATLAERLNNVSDAQINTTKDIVKFVTVVGGAVLIGQKLAPILAAIGANIVAIAASGGLASALGSAGALGALVTMLALITKKLIEMRHATEQLMESSRDLSMQENEMMAKYGTKSTEVLRSIRKAIESQNKEQMDMLQKRFPKAFALALEGQKPKSSASGAADLLPAEKKGMGFSFGSFEDAIKNIQTGLGKQDDKKEQKKQTGLLGSIDGGINKIVESLGDQAVVGV